MLDFLFMLLAFLVAITVLIAVHEFGHFWVARRLGVKVLRYSIGFGRALWRRTGTDGTEYVIAAIPLGGYVKMLDEREGPVPEGERHRAFNRQPLATRAAVVLAGPAFNFLFAIVAYWLWFILGVTGMKPVVGEVAPGTPASVLEPGSEIVAVAGEPTPIWPAVVQAVLPAVISGRSLTVTVRDSAGQTRDVVLDLSTVDPDAATGNLFKALGLTPWRPKGPPQVVQVVPGSPAQRSGFRIGDRILAVNGTAIEAPGELVDYVRSHGDSRLVIEVRRGEETLTLAVRPELRETPEGPVPRIGLATAPGAEIPDEMLATYRYSLWAGARKALTQTWDNSVFVLKVLGKIVTGTVSARNLSGPISIAQYAGQSASAGLAWYLNFLAIVSISLGVINLLPIPVLDGGHLFYYAVELVRGRPVSEAFEAVAQRVGILIIALLMGLAFYNDIARLLG